MSARGHYRVDGYGIGQTADGKIVERDSLQCCHCNTHYFVSPGSGKQRGFCLLCMDVTCGRSACVLCVPFERRLAQIEQRERRARTREG